MKKLVSIFLVLIIMLFVAVVPAFAENFIPGDYFFEDRYLETVRKSTFNGNYNYCEVYYHYVDEDDNDNGSEIDWVFVLADNSTGSPCYIKQVFNDRVVLAYSESYPFRFNYAVYDVNEDAFYGIEDVDFHKYDGLDELLYERRIGIPIGDADGDYRLTILDATFIQQVIAQLSAFSEDDYIGGRITYGEELDYISDFDRDGERTVLDATAIQHKLAGLE